MFKLSYFRQLSQCHLVYAARIDFQSIGRVSHELSRVGSGRVGTGYFLPLFGFCRVAKWVRWAITAAFSANKI